MESHHDSFRRMPRLTGLIVSACLFTPAFAAVIDCGEEHFVSGSQRMPTYAEAMAQCRAEEAAMTHPQNGAYHRARSCYDAGSPGAYGAWTHGRVAVDVVERDTGRAATFESLWMCKPTMARAGGGTAME
ncbi:hypothetical protein P3W24_16150 [Luteibacter sp. PPL201]|uniref:Uncharacterized protein n=1 Tax=Luteibacter sahnii TaxID=3021977 RepID=A0ABT6BET2_9GAMM|nr:hypothetical protein [Luteibacter sp. PPL193]MDY1549746.1 hypothetical protein [Luteibacter sp. PPL193]